MIVEEEIIDDMRKELGIILAGTAGLAVTLGILGLRRFLNRKNRQYLTDYSDYHGHFRMQNTEDHHGIEYWALK